MGGLHKVGGFHPHTPPVIRMHIEDLIVKHNKDISLQYTIKNMQLPKFLNTKRNQIIRKMSQYIDIYPTTITLGRWTVEHCKDKIDHKIELANEDHCGPCGDKGPVKWANVREKSS